MIEVFPPDPSVAARLQEQDLRRRDDLIGEFLPLFYSEDGQRKAELSLKAIELRDYYSSRTLQQHKNCELLKEVLADQERLFNEKGFGEPDFKPWQDGIAEYFEWLEVLEESRCEWAQAVERYRVVRLRTQVLTELLVDYEGMHRDLFEAKYSNFLPERSDSGNSLEQSHEFIIASAGRKRLELLKRIHLLQGLSNYSTWEEILRIASLEDFDADRRAFFRALEAFTKEGYRIASAADLSAVLAKAFGGK